MKKILLTLPLDLYQRVKDQAIEQDRTVTKQIIHLVKKELRV